VAVQSHRLPPFDDPLRRLPLLIPLAVLIWVALLFTFAKILTRTEAPAPEIKPLEARIVEIPPTAGLGAPAAPAAPKAPAAIPHPAEKPKVIHHAPKPKEIEPPVFSSPEGTLKNNGAPPAPPSRGENSTGTASTAPSESGGGAGGVAGSDASGAHAIYAPTPVIPDDLRENVFEAVAVAHFKVSYDGNVEVTLAKPTSNPRLNQILLDTLKSWKFFPAMKEGVATNSEFDIRIPVTVQ